MSIRILYQCDNFLKISYKIIIVIDFISSKAFATSNNLKHNDLH